MTADEKRMTKKLKTNGEVIAAIKRGYGKTVKYDQSKYYSAKSLSSEHPCGTACCMFGAIAANYGGMLNGVYATMHKIMDTNLLAGGWEFAFSAFTSEEAFRRMRGFLTEKQYEEITTFLMKRIK